jgi:hypothetical protein
MQKEDLLTDTISNLDNSRWTVHFKTLKPVFCT